jgi:hypothetical protein
MQKPEIGEYYQNEDIIAVITGWDKENENIVFYKYKTKLGWSLICSWDWVSRPVRKLTPVEIVLFC